MTQTGSFVLVLHGHMPWVLHHGRWPHGETWLTEAAVEVYLPLLEMIERVLAHGARPALSLGLTPVLLEQLSHPSFRRGLDATFEDLLQRAHRDQQAPELAPQARRWEQRFVELRSRWEAVNKDLVGAFAAQARAGHIEILGGFATHGYAALLKHDRCIRAQLRLGLATSERHLGHRPRGIWLPECSFRPTGPWTLPGLTREEKVRAGVDRILEEEGVTHFFVDSHLVAGARSEGLVEGGAFRKVEWTEADRYPGRGWRSVLEGHRVGTHGGPSTLTAYARHPDVSEQVWSAEVGYPGDGRYLEFHRRKDGDGLRYWRVTSRQTDLGDKLPYDPGLVAEVARSQAVHFCSVVHERLAAWRQLTGRPGVVVAAFDAELFGHWWHEGPEFLAQVFINLARDPRVAVQTAAERTASHPPDKVVWLPEGSWGAGGDHRVWLNDRTSWTWDAAWRAEDRYLGLLWRMRQSRSARVKKVLQAAGRELLLLQASDWQFVVETGGAVDYGFRRFCLHLDRFDTLCNAAHDLLEGRSLNALQRLREQEAGASDPCFAELDLSAWESS